MCNLYFFGEQVSQPAMYLVLAGATLVLLLVYILLNVFRKRG